MNNRTFEMAPWQSLLLAGLIFFLCGGDWAKAQPKSKELQEMPPKISEKLSPVTVNIICDNTSSNGSGSIIGITEQGQALILTACHVVATNFSDADPYEELKFYKDIQVKITTELQPVRASVLPGRVDRANDLALIATIDPVSEDRVISYARSDKVASGQQVAAFGYPKYPASDKLSHTVGLVTTVESKYLEFDAEVARGSSGGPLVDKHGRMIGLTTSKGGGNEGYALQMNLVLSVVEGWHKGIELKEKWEHQKHTSIFTTYRIVGGMLLVGGGIAYKMWSGKDDNMSLGEFPKPPGRPNGN